MNRVLLFSAVIVLGLTNFPLAANATRAGDLAGSGREFDRVIGVFTAVVEGDLAHQVEDRERGWKTLDPMHTRIVSQKILCKTNHRPENPPCPTKHGAVEADIADKVTAVGLVAIPVGAAVCFAAGVLYGNAMAEVDPSKQVSIKNIFKSGHIDSSKLVTPKQRQIAELVSSWIVSTGGRILISKALGPIIQGAFASATAAAIATYGAGVAVCFAAGVAGKEMHQGTTKFTQEIYGYVVSRSQRAIQPSIGR